MMFVRVISAPFVFLSATVVDSPSVNPSLSVPVLSVVWFVRLSDNTFKRSMSVLRSVLPLFSAPIPSEFSELVESMVLEAIDNSLANSKGEFTLWY